MPPHPATAASPPTAAAVNPTDASIKETLESLVISFVLAFLLRGFVLEPFVIPTGSMAPTLLGRHVRVVDTQTGFRFTVNPPRGDEARGSSRTSVVQGVLAPMSHFTNLLPVGTPISAGDRILVLKYVYSFSEPRRWDVVVFKNPGLPRQNYIKRLVGLPNERIWLLDGNIYTSPPGSDAWRVARKSGSRRLHKIQSALWQPLYRSQFVPLDYLGNKPGRWHVPWQPASGRWTLNNHGSLDARHGYHLASAESGRLLFDWDFLGRGSGLYPYNELTLGRMHDEPIEDIRLAAQVLPHAAGLGLALSTTTRLDSPDASPWQLIAQIEPDGQARLLAKSDQSGQTRLLAGPTNVGPFQPEHPRHVELWYVDQQATFYLDGRPVLQWQFDLPIDQLIQRAAPPLRPAALAIDLAGAPASLYEVTLDRDVYYSSSNPSAVARGGLVKQRDRRIGEPMTLLPDQFFCLGDNSPASNDGRYWEDPDPWVDHLYFPDDPTSAGIVPRDLMVGRAFFVYWPAPYHLVATGLGVIPNVGDMRFIH